MEPNGSWRILLNDYKGRNSRLIFTGCKHKRLIDITIQSRNVDNIINTVLASSWNAEQVIAFLNAESEKVLREVL